MIRYFRPLLASAIALSFPTLASAADTPKCTTPVAPTGELSSWPQQTPLAATGTMPGLPSATLVVGKAALVTLLPTPQVKYPLRPEKPGGSVSYGGLLGFDVAEAGTYRVALGTGAWIDVVGDDGKAIASTGHGHGPDCTGIRKVVDFPLAPGSHTLQIAASASPEIGLLVVRLP